MVIAGGRRFHSDPSTFDLETSAMAGKTRLDLNIILPAVPDERDACTARLLDLLRAKTGISEAHLVQGPNERQLCIHFDPQQHSIAEVRELAARAGAELGRRYGHLVISTGSMHARKARSVEGKVKGISGVLDANCSPAGSLNVEFDRKITDEATLRRDLEQAGLIRAIVTSKHTPPDTAATEKPSDHDDKEHSHVGLLGERTELAYAAISGLLLLTGWLLSWAGVNDTVPWALYLGAYFFGGFFTIREAVQNVLARRFEIDSLMVVAAIGAATLGKWFEGALLLFLFSLGHSLEHYAMGRAKRAIEALGELAPQTANVRRDQRTEEVPVDQLRVGDVILVKPNERIAADGFVIKGESSVNQAPITGESVPADKRPVDDVGKAAKNPAALEPQHRVFAGTINESSALEVQVTKLSTDSTLARVIEMVSEAETQKSPTQRFTDRFERYFVPAVLAFDVLLLFAWVVVDEPFSASFYRAMAVLVAASPCALAISTPSAVLSGVARAARGGVLVKGGGPLENLGTIAAIAFDKTGTLTEGKPRLTDTIAFDNGDEEELLRVALAVERLSDHPLAAAVVRGAAERVGDDVPDAQDLKSITGRGVQAVVNGEQVHIGKDELFAEIEGVPLSSEQRKQVEELEANGRTTMIVRRGDEYLGVLGLMDTPREAAKRMIAELHALGVKRMIMLSGDNQKVADVVAAAVGIDEAIGDLMPDDKVGAIKRLSREGGVAMVGDGVNDAPALANATVGIAMGAAGSDVALETADVALMADDLSHLPFAVGLSRKTRRVIRQNLWMSLGMVAFLVPATVLGLQIGAAVALHEGSTLVVVANALRLLAYQPRNAVGA
jgi:Cd2+/Zn2+-exporting ATPase